MNELISIIINVYNGEKYIKKCLDSVLNQTYKNIEIIIVDDCSKDDTLKVIKNYKDNRIRVKSNKKNLGLSLSRNVGLDLAKGECLYFVDADDYIEEDTIEYLYKLLKENNVLMSTCECREVYDYNDHNIKNVKEKINIETGKDLLKKILLDTKRNGTTWNKLIKKELFNDLRFEKRIVNDVVVTYKLAIKLDKYVYSNKIKYTYFRHHDSIMGKHKTDREIDLYNAALERYDYIKKIYPDLVENDICMCLIIVFIHEHNNKVADEFLLENNAKKLYDKLFSMKFIFYKIKFRMKIKMILFRISPKLCRVVIELYLKLVGKK